MKVAELEGAQLALWVARAVGYPILTDGDSPTVELPFDPWVASFGPHGFRPDLNWSQGGPVVDRLIKSGHWRIEPWVPEFGIGEGCTVMLCNYESVYENHDYFQRQLGGNDMEPASLMASTVQLAACRALVFSVYGAEVPDQQQEG